MKIINKIVLLGAISTATVFAGNGGTCSNKLFNVTIDNKLTISDVVENIAETCGYSVIVKDEGARLRMNKKLYYVKIKNNTIKGFLNTILKDNDLNYNLTGNKLKIAYLSTRTFRVNYISGSRIGRSNSNVTIANSQQSGQQQQSGAQGGAQGGQAQQMGSSSRTGISIETSNEFKFWNTIQTELSRILVSAGDGSTHYTRTGEFQWTGPDGQVWDYNPMAPVVNPEAGLITVTGTSSQLNRVSRYISSLTKQIKQQVLIDVRILSVLFDNSSTRGVDWNQIYSLQNFTVNSLLMSQKNVASYAWDAATGITEGSFAPGTQPRKGGVVSLTGSVEVNEIVKFLDTQGEVRSISSPRIMTLNNQPALISVGKELFYKIKSTSALGTGNNSNTAEGELVDSVFAGILLDITPQIDSRGIITLRINPSISDVDEQDTVKTDGVRVIPPDLRKRQISSVVSLRDGDHAILGGLITTRTGTVETSVPLLGSIPLIKNAFSKTDKIEKVEELIFIITPHIIKNEKSVNLKDLGYNRI